VSASKSLSILLVEDVAVNRLVTSGLLTQRGHRVVSVVSGGEAIAAVGAQTFDLVLMDIGLPEMDGIEATRRIYADSRFTRASLPIIGLTASLSTEEKARAMAAGMTLILGKPVDPATLEHTLARLSGRDVAGTPPPVVDSERMNRLRETFGEAGLAELLAILRQSIVESAKVLDRDLERQNQSAAAETAHRLAGAAANYGLQALLLTAREIEALSHGGDLGQARALYDRRLLPEIERARASLDHI